MGILNRLLHPGHPDSEKKVNEMVERIIALHPHLRLARRYRAHLAPAVAASLHYIGDLVGTVPESREASAAAWATDPYIRAFFVSADEVAQAISRSADLRAHFERNPNAQEAYAVLGMEMTERHILGVGLEGETLRRDVPQTTLSFSDHQVRMCGNTEAELKMEIVRRLLDQLALEGLEQIAAGKSRRDMLERERALLKTRLQLLERKGTGIRGMLGSADDAKSDELAQLQTEMEENEWNLAGLGLQTEALDRELETVCGVFAHPERHIFLSSKRVTLDRSNVVVEAGSAQEGTELELHFARIPTAPPRTRAFSLVRFARVNLLPAKSMLDEAARLLGSGILS
jgi:hypothetical protein